MDEFEPIILALSGFLSFRFLVKLYRAIFTQWPSTYNKAGRVVLGFLPFASLGIIMFTLKALASFDVVESVFYIFFYIAIGFAWIYFGVFIMNALFDLSWIDDILNMNNKSALSAFVGGFLGVTIIYSAANIGDGPGWWCVIFAGGLGTTTWAILAMIMNLAAGFFERITVERDVPCGIRFGCYLLASAIILGRASAGDWTSFGATVIEFLVGWPALPLAVFAIVIERFYILEGKTGNNAGSTVASVLWGTLFISIAVVSVILLPPMNETPIYKDIILS